MWCSLLSSAQNLRRDERKCQSKDWRSEHAGGKAKARRDEMTSPVSLVALEYAIILQYYYERRSTTEFSLLRNWLRVRSGPFSARFLSCQVWQVDKILSKSSRKSPGSLSLSLSHRRTSLFTHSQRDIRIFSVQLYNPLPAPAISQ